MTSSTATASIDASAIFDMASLRNHLPYKKRGLSKFISGKSRSFAFLGDAKSVDDLRKADIPEAKRRKYSDRQAAAAAFLPSVSVGV